MAGANIIYGLGMLELGITLDFAQLVIDNEIAAMIKWAVKGIQVSDYEMAVNVIKDVGVAGEFVTHQHTYDNSKTGQSNTRLFDRQMREGWEALGGKDLLERATEKAKFILENHKPDPLPDGTADYMAEIIKEAQDEEGL